MLSLTEKTFPLPGTHLELSVPWSRKEMCFTGFRQSPTSQTSDRNIPGEPGSGCMDGAGGGWKGNLLTGDWLGELSHASISRSSTAWVTVLSTEHLPHRRPDACAPSSHPTAWELWDQGPWPSEGNSFLSSLNLYYVFPRWYSSYLAEES